MTYSLGTAEGFRILLISDLHINPNKSLPQDIDLKNEIGNIKEELPNNIGIFISTLKRIFHNVPEDDYPKAIIVSGDIVNKGGADKNEDKNEFDVARDFLQELANTMRVQNDRILVVPGNHDVDWSSKGIEQSKRFDNYIQAVDGFQSPYFKDGKLTPQIVTLNNIKDSCYGVEILLLVSPTYSGITDSEDQKIAERILKPLNDDIDESTKLKILAELQGAKGRLDIAAIGRYQRDFIRRISSNQNDKTIRIAVMHHHLLPDPQLEVTNFEAVLDSGRVLNELIDSNFDLVLTGHKHNKKFATFSLDDRNRHLDIFSSPSLFYSTNTCRPSFSLIEINKPSSPHYAHIYSFLTESGEKYSSNLLERQGRVLPEVKKICTEIPQNIQRDQLLSLLSSVKSAFDWSGEEKFSKLFNDVWQNIYQDFEKLGNKKLIFRAPYLKHYWGELIRLASKSGDKTLKLVSENDLIYWLSSKEKGSEASQYLNPLREFSGQKERILIFDGDEFFRKDEKQREDISTVVETMIDQDKFIVHIVFKNQLPPRREVDRDFGIIGGFAVSRFDGEMRTAGRSLEESFAAEDLKKAYQDWDILCRQKAWSSNSETAFTEWLNTIN